MSRHLSRRNFIKLAAAAGGATIIGFDLRERSWVTQAQAQTRSFQDVPKLDGVLLFDEATRKAIAIDRGNVYHRIPAAVLRPGSVQDVVKMVRYANQRSLKIAVKGQAHSYYGQTQAEAGIVIDSGSLNAVQAPIGDSVDAQPGAVLGQVGAAALAKNLTPPVLTAQATALRKAAEPPEVRELARTVDEMEKSFQARRATLDPAVKAIYEKGLESLDSSIDECRTSVEQEPQNSLASEYLVAAYTQKAAVLESALQFEGH